MTDISASIHHYLHQALVVGMLTAYAVAGLTFLAVIVYIAAWQPKGRN